ncbi:MAG: hypothetical protein CBD86_01015 [Gammaproteobacteria bacterium TMED226]|nr:hypothetical protein [Flavobacteriales bacterium]OUW89176.1 MAG: hypothetical protein CBD86_01015 [Gammaproteobacteria bacterium TMED226]|tara:strand:- start:1725 stop:2168 length:444 start_codon:yes stop_codon:yes gene_type:complete
MTYFKRFLIIFICGIVQIFYAAYLLLNLFGYSVDWHISNHSVFMFIPGILVFVSSGILCASYYLGDRKTNNILYDEYTALRYYKIAAVGYALNGIGIFILFSIQDWANWNFQSANDMIYQIAAFAWLTFGVLLTIFSVGDYKEHKNG